MNTTTICTHCRAALRRRRLLRLPQPTTVAPASQASFSRTAHPTPPTTTTTNSKPAADSTPQEILARPTWSVRSLLPPSAPTTNSASPNPPEGEQEEEITPKTLRHLLRLSALPPPTTAEEEFQLLATLRSQLHFVRSIQSIDTTGVPPLVSIRDETAAGVREQTIGLETLAGALAREDVVGHNRRPRRRGSSRRAVTADLVGAGGEEGVVGAARKTEQIQGVEDWDVLKGASEKVGKYFVVRSGPGR